MADTPAFRSSVSRPVGPSGALALTDVSALTKVSVRAGAETAAATAMAVGFGASRRADDVLIAGIRPDEWLVIGPRVDVDRTLAAVDMSGFAHAIDTTHGRVCLRLTGADSARVLEKVCNLDFSDHMTPDGAATSASVAKVTCDLIRDDVDRDRSYLILADRSYGQYLFDALVDAAADFLG